MSDGSSRMAIESVRDGATRCPVLLGPSDPDRGVAGLHAATTIAAMIQRAGHRSRAIMVHPGVVVACDGRGHYGCVLSLAQSRLLSLLTPPAVSQYRG